MAITINSKKETEFDQELLTQDLVTFEDVSVNISRTVIIATDDRIHLWLIELINRLQKRKDWIAPFSLVIAITLTLVTAKFKDFIIPSSTWHAVFVIIDILAFIWLMVSLRSLRIQINPKIEIEKLKTFSTRQSEDK